MTYREIIARLERAGIEDCAYDAACLIAHACKNDLLQIRTNPDRDYSSELLSELVARREAHEPLQYLIGEWDFYHQTYRLSPDCLIPRSDTECLVSLAIEMLPQGAHFADLCTGSGCIAISTLAERCDTTALALDKFPNTLSLAIENAARNRVSDRFTPRLLDVLCPPTLPDGSFDAILSNPPYIEASLIDTLSPEVQREPRAALDGGVDGLDFYRAILAHWTRTLKKDGFLLFEIGYDQGEALSTLAREHGFCAQIHRDLSGNDRVVHLKKL